MSCRRWERYVSDAQDGELSPRRRRRLEDHVAACPACRSYAGRLRVLHAQARGLEDDAVPPQDMRDMHARLKERLYAEAGAAGEAAGSTTGSRRLRVWLAGGTMVAAAAAVLVLLVLPRQEVMIGDEYAVFSIDEALAQVFTEMEGDPELERSFNAVIASSLRGLMDTTAGEIGPGLNDSPLLWQDLTEEELRFLENAIKKEMKS